MTTLELTLHDEAQIQQLIADRDNAVGAKDVDGIMAHYAADVVFFDVKPPYQIKGANQLRRAWDMCLPYLPDSFEIETRDLRIIASGNLAVAHGLFHFTGMSDDHPATQTWMRSTVSFTKCRGQWQIVHEHGSVPFDPETSQAVFTLEP
jgi:uncharacterized protein (TIGR02246 family)